MTTPERSPRSRSPTREHKRRRHHSRSPHTRTRPRALPLNARELDKHDLRTYKPLFSLYLDIQKQIEIEDLEESEVKGRWKSFVNKWNRGELAEGWYDPATLNKAIDAEQSTSRRQTPPSASTARRASPVRSTEAVEENDDEDDFGPSLPTYTVPARLSVLPHHATRAPGPSIPTTSDLVATREAAIEAAAAARASKASLLREERKAERALQAQRLEELAPRAAAGSRERQLEKRREVAASNNAFAQSAHDAGDVEVREADVMGDTDSLGELKRMKKEHERKKNERELRREEMLRARRAEREERLAIVRQKEEKTIGMLQELARARFGGGATAGETGGG
ncbi:uncharacterized protein HMPREF1541_07218 [Cyphellophora europaea CBS 101466]|uniref:Uncharacterized protein n=1 Tax=Cyphellophora europaea (strain CBS 101466) TaxID=1220924 RepID=W2RM50_CYPE1|nr:uncharacterized protein HMPREF1541_07218 [Cyphellophora europaea CBS 101466]ETN37596.1 hypothetical protein HMPREF1541_07218 [Cyphellophora europaea CBS 101466]